VGQGLLGPRDDRVVELLHLLHRAAQPLGVPLRLGGQDPVREAFQIGEFRRKFGGHRPATPAAVPVLSRSYRSIQSAVSLCRWRMSTSGSHSTQSSSTPVSIIDWVASSVLASCMPYSLNDAAASSWATRSRGVRAAGKYRLPSKTCVL